MELGGQNPVHQVRTWTLYSESPGLGNFPGSTVVKDFALQCRGVQVRFLIGELRSHMASWPKNQNIKQKQYCKKFNKDFKNGPHQKKEKKKSLKKKRESRL